VEDITLTVNTLLDERNPTTLFDPTKISSELKEIEEELPPNLELGLSKTRMWDFYKLKMHLVPKDGRIYVVAAIPQINRNDIYHLEKHIPTPIVVNNELEVIVDPPDRLLITNDAMSSFREVRRSELAACTIVNTLYCICVPIYERWKLTQRDLVYF
jgi:hypothetical protein